MDAAFLRRFTYRIVFGRPGQQDRMKIWQKSFPPELPLSADVDTQMLSQFGMTGGNIRNCVRDAAARAASQKAQEVNQTSLLWAVKRELEKHDLPFRRETVGELYWRDVAPEWEFKHFPKVQS
jgi:SpoVK/Ycf46/Vps4 family AAA+-type ATPase